MRRAGLLFLFFLAGGVTAQVACGSSDTEPAPFTPGDASAPPGADGGIDANGDPRCATKAVALPVHPHAPAQKTDLGKTLGDVRGWHGRLYFGYGDLEENTGPIVISSLDPKTKTWQDHPLDTVADGGVVKADAFATHVIQRFTPIGDRLWAGAGQPDFRPYGAAAAPEYAVGTADHTWAQADIAPNGIHIGDVVERVPGEILVVGSELIPEPDAGPNPATIATAAAWRSIDGGAFVKIFPIEGDPNYDRSGAWFYGAALNGTAYLAAAGYIYQYDGTGWSGGHDFGELLRPDVIAGRLVFADLGHLFSFDGTKRHDLDFRFFESPGRYNALLDEPLALFEVTEGRLVAVNHDGHVMMTTDLASWTCIGQAPADATAIGSLDGTVYFGGLEGHVYGLEAPSW